jgi:hypothetical protein
VRRSRSHPSRSPAASSATTTSALAHFLNRWKQMKQIDGIRANPYRQASF